MVVNRVFAVLKTILQGQLTTQGSNYYIIAKIDLVDIVTIVILQGTCVCMHFVLVMAQCCFVVCSIARSLM